MRYLCIDEGLSHCLVHCYWYCGFCDDGQTKSERRCGEDLCHTASEEAPRVKGGFHRVLDFGSPQGSKDVVSIRKTIDLNHIRLWNRKELRGTSITRKSAPLGPYSRNMPRVLWRPSGGGLFLMSEVPL